MPQISWESPRQNIMIKLIQLTHLKLLMREFTLLSILSMCPLKTNDACQEFLLHGQETHSRNIISNKTVNGHKYFLAKI